MKILQKLKKYFEDNEEQILADSWEKTKNSDCINAPSVDEFLLYDVVEPFYCDDADERLTKCKKQCKDCLKLNE